MNPDFPAPRVSICCYLLEVAKMVRNECVRYVRHVDIEVSYKNLQLEILKEVPIFHNSACFQ
jgi:hypothetical protein